MTKPMSETIWKSEIDAGLLAFIREHMTLDEEGAPMQAYVRVPHEEIKTEHFPCMSIYNTFDTENVMRRQWDRFHSLVVHRDYDALQALVEKPPQPVDVRYQVDFWSKSNRQMDSMTRKWLGKCTRFFNLDCSDASNNVRSIFCRQSGNLQKSDYFDAGQKIRVFHSSIDYIIWAELYERDAYAVATSAGEGPTFKIKQS